MVTLQNQLKNLEQQGSSCTTTQGITSWPDKNSLISCVNTFFLNLDSRLLMECQVVTTVQCGSHHSAVTITAV